MTDNLWEDRVAVLAESHGEVNCAITAAVLAGLEMQGIQIVNLNRDRWDDLTIFDSFSLLDDRPVDPMGFRLPHRRKLAGRTAIIDQMFNGLAGDVTHVVTDKPISKRRARRLRGRGKGPSA